MESKSMVTALVLTVLFASHGLASAADKKTSKPVAGGMPGMESMQMDHGMMMQGGMGQGGMMEMMNMMNSCRHMMGDSMMPQLPAGNEKLQLQMHAEMMQRMGEIMAKYADRIKDEKRTTP
ncbi:MAG: hypothetical protein M3Z31_08425 [Pseudomonadota bacterium]|nr:hypothetical protein [Pseudomonadota bacterium]